MSSQHPGKILQNQYLAANSISQNRLARAIGVPPRRINEIVLGKRAITADTAVRLAAYFGNSAAEWMQLQAEHEIRLARAKLGPKLGSIQNTGAPAESPATRAEQSGNTTTRIRRRIMR